MQSTYTQQQLSGVVRTLIEAHHLHRHRDAVLPALVAQRDRGHDRDSGLAARHARSRCSSLDFTLDTVSLLAMTLIIGILVDDSIVVLENVERHFADGRVARRGGDQRTYARSASPRSSSPWSTSSSSCRSRSCRVRSGSFLREFGARRDGRDPHLALRLVHRHAVAGRALGAALDLEAVARHRLVHGALRPRRATGTSTARSPWGLRHGRLVVARSRRSRSCCALALIPLGWSASNTFRRVDRGELYITLHVPDRHAARRRRGKPRSPSSARRPSADLRAESTIAGAYRGTVSGYLTNGAIAQIDIYLKDNRAHSTAYWAAQFRKRKRRKSRPTRKSSSCPQPDISRRQRRNRSTRSSRVRRRRPDRTPPKCTPR